MLRCAYRKYWTSALRICISFLQVTSSPTVPLLQGACDGELPWPQQPPIAVRTARASFPPGSSIRSCRCLYQNRIGFRGNGYCTSSRATTYLMVDSVRCQLVGPATYPWYYCMGTTVIVVRSGCFRLAATEEELIKIVLLLSRSSIIL